MNQKYLGPRVTPQDIFENIFVFTEIFTKKGFFCSDFQNMMPGCCTTSGYHNPEVAQPVGYNTQRFCNLRVL